MASLREVRLRIKSVKNISQVTRALQAVSTSRVRRAMQMLMQTRPYAEKAWTVLEHLANQSGRSAIHPLLLEKDKIQKVLFVVVSGERGLAGAYNFNLIRYALQTEAELLAQDETIKFSYITIGRKGRDILARYKKNIIAEFSKLPAFPSFVDISSIGKLIVNEFLSDNADEVFVIYTDFVNMMTQIPTRKRLLPIPLGEGDDKVIYYIPSKEQKSSGIAYTFEPDEAGLLDQIIPRFSALQVYQAILESLASEHAARMVAMRNATDNANELVNSLQLQYNKARQQGITNDMIDIVGGAEALSQSEAS